MIEQRLYAGIIREGVNTLTVHFHDLKFDAKPVETSDLNVAINHSLEELSEQLNKLYSVNKSLPSPTALYQIHKHTGEIARVLLSYAVDTKNYTVESSGYLLATTMNDSGDLLWEDVNSIFGQMKNSVTASDDYRQFKKYRDLMGITDKVKSKMHSQMNELLDTCSEEEDDGFIHKLGNMLGRGEGAFSKTFRENWKISVEVYNRLLLRYTILRDVEKLEKRYGVHGSLISDTLQPLVSQSNPSQTNKSEEQNTLASQNTSAPQATQQTASGEKTTVVACVNMAPQQKSEQDSREKKTTDAPTPDVRAYRLATTDVFVEKAIVYLENDAAHYTKYGLFAYCVTIVLLFFGVFLSGYTYLSEGNYNKPGQLSAPITQKALSGSSTQPQTISISGVSATAQSVKLEITSAKSSSHSDTVTPDTTADWKNVIVRFTQGFTFYGMLVLTIVGLWRVGRAMLDQAERLKDRRHALRQGRLFVHLNDGTLKPDDLEKAFAWNTSNRNAFENIQTEASAPWGGVFKEGFKAIAEALKSKKD